MTSSADRLRALAANATPGPWRWGTGEENGGDWPPYYLVTVEEYPTRSVGPLSRVVVSDDPPSEADARLIALAPDLAVWAADAADALDSHECPHPIDLGREWPKCEVCGLLARFDRLGKEDARP